jgi:ribosomal protein L40E
MDKHLNSARDRRGLGPRKTAALIATFALALVMAYYGWTAGFGMFVIGTMLYMVPHLFGVDNKKLLGAYGIAFMAVALAVGIGISAPAVVADRDVPPADDAFSDITCTYSDGITYVTAVYAGELGEGEAVLLSYGVTGIGFTERQIYGVRLDRTAFSEAVHDPVGGTTAIAGEFGLDPDVLHLVGLGVLVDDEVVDETYNWFLTGSFEGDASGIYLSGVGMSIGQVMLVFFAILIFSTLMRRSLGRTRERMEQEGRLYPVGYGRCDNCRAIVLPGEVNCRKCGAYIDRPDEMKPDKHDMVTCSECGAEVTPDAEKCPRCGVVFEDTVVEYIDPPTMPPTMQLPVICPECGTLLPPGTGFCPKCGRETE